MKHIYFVLVTLLFCSVQTIAQQSNIPSDQKLYIDFNGGISATSEQGLPIENVGTSTFSSDRNNALFKAGTFGGCSSLSYLKVDDITPHIMDFSTGGTIALWAKIDTTSSMDPNTGQCTTGSRHTLFSKGGDDFNTPPGFYAYTSINNGIQTIAFRSSANSGNTEFTFTLPYTDVWHHYAFVFTSTNLKVYVDGVQKQNVAFTLTFSEANNQSLYIGTLGPKSTPVAGITYWFPFKGSMDDFRLFTKELTASEVQDVFTAGENPVSPSVKTITKIQSSSRNRPVSVAVQRIEGKTIVVRSAASGEGMPVRPETSSYLIVESFDNSDQLIWRDSIQNCSSSSLSSQCTTYAGAAFAIPNKPGEIGVTSFSSSAIQVLDLANGQTKFTTSGFSTGFQPSGRFYTGGSYVFYGAVGSDYKINKVAATGMVISIITVPNEYINDAKWNGNDKLLLAGNAATYVVDVTNGIVTQVNYAAKGCSWINTDFIISNDTYTYKVDAALNATLLTTDKRDIYPLNDGGYLLTNDTGTKKYNSSHVLIVNLPSIKNFQLLPISNNLFISTNSTSALYDNSGNLIWTMSNIEREGAVEVTGGYLLTRRTDVLSAIRKVTNAGFIEWSKFIRGALNGVFSGNEVLYLTQYSIPQSGNDFYLTRLTTLNNPCDFTIASNLKDEYCTSSTVFASILLADIKINQSDKLAGLPTDLEAFWEKDGVRINNSFPYNNYEVNVNSSGIYKAIIKQSGCTKSIQKTVSFTAIPAELILTGNSPATETYRAEKINSTQNVIINSMIDYKSKKSIELKPGFSTAANAVFNAKIVSSCVE